MESALEVAQARRSAELARFDVVHHLNQLEARKVLMLHDTINVAVGAFSQFAAEANAVLAHRTARLQSAERANREATAALALDEEEWAAARATLQQQLDSAVESEGHEPAQLTVRLLSEATVRRRERRTMCTGLARTRHFAARNAPALQ